MRQIKKNQGGFTLIELVVVIVILGILAATAIPKFVDLSTEAGNAAASGVAGAIASGSSANFAAKLANKEGTVSVNGTNVCSAAMMGNFATGVTFLDSTTNPKTPENANQYLVSGAGNCSSAAAGTTVSCKIKGFKGGEQDATVVCTSA